MRNIGKKTPDYRSTIHACYVGFIMQAIVNNLAPLLFVIFQEEFSLSLSEITLLTTVNFFTQILVDLLTARIADRIGYRACLIAAHFFAAAGLIGLSVLPDIIPGAYGGLLAAVVLYAVGGGVAEVLLSPVVEACPVPDRAAAMSLLHSFYCWGTIGVVLLSTLFLSVFGKGAWRWLPLLWSLLPVLNGFRFAGVPIRSVTGEEKGLSCRKLFSLKLFRVFFVLMICSGASEQAMSQWASAFAETGLGVSKTLGDLLGPCFFSLLMGLSRTFYGKRGEKISLLRFIRLSAALCAASYLLTVFSGHAFLSLLCCGLTGLSVGILWPGVFSLSSSMIPAGGTAMFAILALAGDIGCDSGPTLVGFTAKLFGSQLKAGILAGLVFPVLLFAASFLLPGKAQRTERA